MASKNAQTAVKFIISDITGRAGLGDEMDQIDDDILAEIKKKWAEIIDKAFSGFVPLGKKEEKSANSDVAG